jgi:uncharacterized membrane protein
MADAAPAAPGFWRHWRYGILIAILTLPAVSLLTWMHETALGIYRQAGGDAGGLVAWIVLAILMVCIYLVIAPVVVSRLLDTYASPSIDDHNQRLFEEIRARKEQHEATLDRLAAKVGLDWQVSAIGRIRLLVRQGRDREATELYQQESGLSGWEAGEAIKAWDAKVAEAKLHLLLRHLDRLAGGGVPT